jgi:multiple sugar transport system ATP-binding protein
MMNDVPSKDRDIAMVFQNYALYPHMTVYKNMAFGLQLRKAPREFIDEKVKEAANILDITHLLNRKPKALSGGQRQRVALGRAIVREPAVFLFDEPLSNLDAKMRVEMRAEIIRLHQRLGTTMIYVTHDQTEAMTMGKRIVVMNEGRIQQAAPPLDVYERPSNPFVAGFIGTPPMNLFPAGTLSPSHIVGVRPEHITLSPADTADAVTATVDFIEPLGSETLVHLHYGEGRLPVTVRIPGFAAWRSGDRTVLRPDMSKAVEF